MIGPIFLLQIIDRHKVIMTDHDLPVRNHKLTVNSAVITDARLHAVLHREPLRILGQFCREHQHFALIHGREVDERCEGD